MDSMVSKTFPTLSRGKMKSDRKEMNFHSISWWLITRSSLWEPQLLPLDNFQVLGILETSLIVKHSNLSYEINGLLSSHHFPVPFPGCMTPHHLLSSYLCWIPHHSLSVPSAPSSPILPPAATGPHRSHISMKR